VVVILKNPVSITLGLSFSANFLYPMAAKANKAMADVATKHCKKENKFPVKHSEKAMPNGYPIEVTYLCM